MLSLGDWRWDNDVTDVDILNEDQDVIQTVDLFIKDLHVGDAAQTTLALGANYKITSKTKLILDYNYFGDLYADFDPSDRGEPGADAWKLPSYGLFDAIISHGFSFGSFDATLTARMNNVFDTEYVTDAFDGTAETAKVYFGYGRTFSIGAKLKF